MMKSRFTSIIGALALGAGIVLTLGGLTTPNSIITPQTPNRGLVRFLMGTDSPGTYKTLYTAGANGSRCYGIWSSSTDAVAHPVQLGIFNSGVEYFGVGFTSASYAAQITTINVMTGWVGLPVDQYGNPYIQMVSGDTLQATFSTAGTATASVYLYASCSDF